jgi:hypothetical protein
MPWCCKKRFDERIKWNKNEEKGMYFFLRDNSIEKGYVILSHLHKEVHSNKSFPSTDPILTQNPGAP